MSSCSTKPICQAKNFQENQKSPEFKLAISQLPYIYHKHSLIYNIYNHYPGGSTAVLINRRFIHQQVQIPITSIENTTVYLRLGYRGGWPLAEYIRHLTPLDTADIHILLDSDMSVIEAGDFNINNTIWSSSKAKAAKNLLECCINTKNDITAIAPNSLTYYSDILHHTPGVLDNAIMKTVRLRFKREKLTNSLWLDHTGNFTRPSGSGNPHIATKASPYHKLSKILNWPNGILVNLYTRTKE